MEYKLLEKTELWIQPVKLNRVDLTACAQAAAEALRLRPDDVMVTDAIGDTLTLDILVPTVKAEQIVARKEILLKALQKVPGLNILHNTQVHSDGILGLISLSEETGKEILERSKKMAATIAENIRWRSMVCSTGQEVLARQIVDTNTPYLVRMLEAAGYSVTTGPVLEDRADKIARFFRRAAEEGYGLLITTGGIGAEGKDQTLEALAQVDAQACMPHILKFEKGEGRHFRDSVRIGVGVLNPTLIVCLPGPHDEVRLVWPTLRNGLQRGWSKDVLAESLAKVLRKKFLRRSINKNTYSW